MPPTYNLQKGTSRRDDGGDTCPDYIPALEKIAPAQGAVFNILLMPLESSSEFANM
jgi:hypothetical protein